MRIAVDTHYIDEIIEAEVARTKRRADGQEIPSETPIEVLLGHAFDQCPFPVWAKWVHWISRKCDQPRPIMGGMAYVNLAYRSAWPHINIRTYVRSGDRTQWPQATASEFETNDLGVVKGIAGPRFWEELRFDGAPSTQVDVLKWPVRDSSGTIVLAVGMALSELSGAWRGADRQQEQGRTSGGGR
ncbi:MAG: hypothetical protein ACU85V_00255 [Gammaproteobacteria bacterium]